MKEIAISPYNEKMVKPASYRFTLGNKIFMPYEVDEIDAVKTSPLGEEVPIGKEGYVIKPGEFILGQTAEAVSLSQNVCCILDARTSLVRIGLNCLQGSTFIEPGQEESHETLEISNISKSPIRIYAGMEIVKGIFMLLSHTSEKAYVDVGKYGKQSKPNKIV